MAQTPLLENRHDGGFIVSEARGHRSRDPMTFSGAVKHLPGEVVARKAGGTAAAAAKAGNTGNGAFTLDATTPVLPNAQAGVYVVRCTAAAANSGTFRVFDPTGDVIGDVVVGQTFSDGIKFAIADGATDFVVGDEFDVTVSLLSASLVPLNPTATDGTQIAAGIGFGTYDATLADVPGLAVVRDAEVNGGELIWPAGITTAQLNAAKGQLAALGIITR
ncbi:Putative phage protein Gp19 [Paraburkholderia caribensis]|uniref:head decoration protein n=1 Tax=Paraburkholderia caribensis TaxID=75105 RepID=UPI001CAB6633|nr:head decoration protein [Paraburkholderia caribensis]CAG9194227.1 Putative phage protein Gp19 [Paraburkholderia caribensis]